MSLALYATIHTDIPGMYTRKVSDLTYDKDSQCFVFVHDNKIQWLPRERVLSIEKEG